MLIKYFCKVSAYTKLFFFHSLICMLFHVKTKWLPAQHLKPIESQNGLNDGLER